MIHASRLAVSREHRRAKTDRLDTELLKRGFLGWLRGERGHCGMARVPTIAEEDAKRPNRERDCLVRERTRIVNRIKSTLARLGNSRVRANTALGLMKITGLLVADSLNRKPENINLIARMAGSGMLCEEWSVLNRLSFAVASNFAH